MKEVLGQVKKLRPEAGDLIVVELEEDQDRATIAMLCELLGELGHEAAFVVLPTGISVHHLNQETLSHLGLQRVRDDVIH